MEIWRKVFRGGFAPRLSAGGLSALARGLEADDPRLIQGATTRPPPLACVQGWPCEGGCAIAYALAFAGDGGRAGPLTVGEAEEAFGRACLACDEALGEPAACRWFLSWQDDTPRAEMRAQLLAEVLRALESRGRP